MKLLVHLAVILLLAGICLGEEPGQGGPRLEIAGVYGILEQDRPSFITVSLVNNASAHEVPPDANQSHALDITAELRSSDDRIAVLSGPQAAGTLAPGENRSVKFTARAEGTQKGIYPLTVRLAYSRLTEVVASGDERLPSIVFRYQDIIQELPLTVSVMRGPDIRLESVEGAAIPGKEADLWLVYANRGDMASPEFQVRVRARDPFRQVESEIVPIKIDPGGTATTKLVVYTDENATPGDYPLPCSIIYPSDAARNEDGGLVVWVQGDTLSGLLLPGMALILLAAGLLAAGRYRGRGRQRQRRRR